MHGLGGEADVNLKKRSRFAAVHIDKFEAVTRAQQCLGEHDAEKCVAVFERHFALLLCFENGLEFQVDST